MESLEARPNIRIEFPNNSVVPMEVDNNETDNASDLEEGQIEEAVSENSKPSTNRIWSTKTSDFTTGINIFDKEEQSKLSERANRFGLKPNKIANFTDENLRNLYSSLGINADNEKNVRLEVIHMRGTDEMSTENVFEYFGKYMPTSIEWISDESCNVVWDDKIASARALHFTSTIIKGTPFEGPCDPFATDAEDKENKLNKSILLINKEREVEFEKDDTQEVKEGVSISDINVPIPPGYWRLGVAHPKSKCILLRLAFKTDKKPSRAEKFSEYYKKHGNPNYGGLKGIITESKRNQLKGIFDRNKDIKVSEDSKNPWGNLAENWDQDERYAEKIPERYTEKIHERYAENVPTNHVQRHVANSNAEKSDVLKRLGVKRVQESDSDDSSEEEVTAKKSKVPRMRMYADEEEEKIKRKKQLQEIKLLRNPGGTESDENVQDLRKIIGNKSEKVRQALCNTTEDLGARLKNRTRTIIHEPELHPVEIPEPRIILRRPLISQTTSRFRSDLEENPIRHKPEHKSSHNSRTNYIGRYKNTLHSDRRERKLAMDEEEVDHKPKSKVTVVVKTQKRPTVASTVWSRIQLKKERLKTASERLQASNESSSSSDSVSDTSDSSSESSSDNEVELEKRTGPSRLKLIERPGFRNNEQSTSAAKNKSPLRIEINNDHFKEE